MRRLLPGGDPLEPASLYADLDLPTVPGRPTVYLGMVSSLDGATTVGGVSGPLGGEGDRHAFRALRAAADAVLVGAGTVRAEDYRGVRLPSGVQQSRTADGRDAVPPIVVVTSRVDLDPRARLFVDTSRPPWLLVPEDADDARLAPLTDVAQVVRAGEGRVDLRAALQELHARGVQRLLCEGGPTLNGQLLAAGLVDELFLTLAPVLAGTPAQGVVDGLAERHHLRLVAIHEHDGDLLLRLRPTGQPTP